jgi:septum site-determining protein MinC
LKNSDYVIVKGVRDGLLLILNDDAPFSDVLTQLSALMSAHLSFFGGAGVTVNAGRRIIERPDFDALYTMLTGAGMTVNSFVSLSAQSRMVSESFGVAGRPPSFAAGDAGGSTGSGARRGERTRSSPDGARAMAEAGSGLFLRRNLRAGQSVQFDGDVCVLGNVDAGAGIVAGGDVVVWGILSGTVHAGADGDDEAVVCALRLSPVQLGIAGAISRFPAQPDPEPGSYRPPELARIEAGRIVVEAWQAGEDQAH